MGNVGVKMRKHQKLSKKKKANEYCRVIPISYAHGSHIMMPQLVFFFFSPM